MQLSTISCLLVVVDCNNNIFVFLTFYKVVGQLMATIITFLQKGVPLGVLLIYH